MREANEPQWLTWSRELQGLAQTGLAFSKDPYDRERYVQLRELASRMMAAHSDAAPERIAELFRHETGYATPRSTCAPPCSTTPTASSWCASRSITIAGRCPAAGPT